MWSVVGCCTGDWGGGGGGGVRGGEGRLAGGYPSYLIEIL